MIALTVFWSSIFLMLAVFVGFPVLLWLRSRFCRNHHAFDDQHRVSVTLVLAAYNEEDCIEEKIQNIKQLHCYDEGWFDAVVASDGSDDGTNAILSRHDCDKLKCLLLPRRGKAQTLNEAMSHARGDILVFSDANSLFQPDAIEKLVRHFLDPYVGGVAGDQRYFRDVANIGTEGEIVYWNFDRKLKEWESRCGNVIAATGGIYAIRKVLFETIPEGVTDDFFVSTNVVRKGSRLLFDADAIAYERTADDMSSELGRKVRIISRGLYAVVLARELLNPIKYGFYALQFLIHKVVRRLLFVPLLLAFLANLFLVDVHWIYSISMIGQVIVYGIAFAGWQIIRRGGTPNKLLSIPTYACLVYVAAMIASWNLIRGKRIRKWENHRQSA